MEKTKAVLYLLPFFLVLSCFVLLMNQQHITMIALLLIISTLITSYITGWITIIVVLVLLQIILTLRDAIFWCIVSKWNLEQKKAFIQAYSGVDLMEELDDQERQLDTLRMLYVQQLRANEEMQLIQSSTTHADPNTNENAIVNNHNNDASSSSEMEPEVGSIPPPDDIYNPITSDSAISRHSNAVLAASNTNTSTVLGGTTPSDDATKAIHQLMDMMNTENSEASTSDYTTDSKKQHDQTDTMVVHQGNNTPGQGSVTGTNILKLMNPVTPYTPSLGYVYDNSKYKVTPTNASNTAASLMGKSQEIRKESTSTNVNEEHRDSTSVSAATMVKKDSMKIVKPTRDSNNNLALHINAEMQDRTPSATISDDQESSNPLESPDMDTPVPESLIKPKGDSMLLKTPILPQIGPIQDEEPYQMVADNLGPSDGLFDNEEDLNTPYDEDQAEEDELKDLMHNTQPVQTPIDPMARLMIIWISIWLWII
eukprot:180906_1